MLKFEISSKSGINLINKDRRVYGAKISRNSCSNTVCILYSVI